MRHRKAALGGSSGRLRAAPLLACALLLWGCADKPPPVAAASADRLEAGKPIERAIAPGETHVYEIAIPEGHVARGVVEQRGVDVEVRVIDPTGATIATVDSPNGTLGPEPWSTAETRARGAFRLEVKPLDLGAKPGRYEARIDEVITAAEHAERGAKQRYQSPRLLKLWREHRADGPAAIERFAREMEGHAPLVEPLGGDPRGDMLVTFAWRARPGTRYVELLGGPIWRSGESPLLSFEGTDLLYLTVRAPSDARFTYRFREGDPPNPMASRKQLLASLADAKPDPWNPRQSLGASLAELPGAPAQPWAERSEGVPQGRVVETSLHSNILGEDRPLGIYLPPAFDPSAAPYPVVIVFDGEAAGLRPEPLLPVPTILDNLIARGKVAPMLAVLVASQNSRERDLGMSAPFSDFLAKELTPWLRRAYPVAKDPARVTLAGVSLGGLCAAYTAFHHPEIFGNALSQSGSFWFSPGAFEVESTKDLETGGLMREMIAAPKKPVRFWLEIGLFESNVTIAGANQLAQNRHMRDVLLAKDYDVRYHEYAGGHDWASWRGTFADGLIALTAAPANP